MKKKEHKPYKSEKKGFGIPFKPTNDLCPYEGHKNEKEKHKKYR